MTNSQRALWTLLFYSLVAPFFAAVVVAAVLALTSVLGLSGALALDQLPLGEAVLASFVWSIVPATLAALVLAALTLRSGAYSWIVAATAGVIAFAVAGLLFPIPLEDARPYLAFLAGLVSVAVREVLIRAGVLAP